MLIASGSEAWVNRRILSNRLLVGIGLISFPIYLWHWVLLAFPYIMNDGEPSPATRIVSVVLCVALAWATYRFIEAPLRHGRNGKLKTSGLAVAGIWMAAIGLTTQYTNLVTSQQVRSLGAKQLENHRQLSWEWNATPPCVQRYGAEFEQYCQIGDAAKDPEILLIGDSNGNHLIYGLDVVNPGSNALMLGRGACPPLLGVTTRIAEGERDCGPTMSKAIGLAATMPSVKTVVLSMMGPGYVNGRRSLVSGSFLEIHGITASQGQSRADVFAEGLRKTLSALSATTKQVIFVISTPRLDFQPTSCIDDRPLRLSAKPLKSPCAMPRATFDRDSRDYRRLVQTVLSEFPRVKVFDAAEALCDTEYCHAMKDGRLLYRDDVHLSIDGSTYLARKIAEAYPAE
jgi:hypothetical protein